MNVYTVGTFDLLHVEHPALLELPVSDQRERLDRSS